MPGEEEFADASGAITPWLDEPESVLDRDLSEDESARLIANSLHFSPRALLNTDAVGMAVTTLAGDIIAQSASFPKHVQASQLAVECVETALKGRQIRIDHLAFEEGGEMRTMIFAYVPRSQALSWQIPEQQKRPLRDIADAVLLLSFDSRTGHAAVLGAAESFCLTPMETRIVMGLVETGRVNAAADAAGITYATARKAMTDILRKTGSNGIAQLVRRLSLLSFGVLPGTRNPSAILNDMWGVSTRQATLGLLLAEGLPREEAAKRLGMSKALVKKETERLFDALGVGNVASLARLMSEIDAVQHFSAMPAAPLGMFTRRAEPLRFIAVPDGRRIAVSDHGPVNGRPCIYVHSSMSMRAIPSRLCRALQAAGYRPISVDRPGFGLTDPLPGFAAGRDDPFAAAAEDFLHVIDALKLTSADLVARGGAQFALALERSLPGFIDRAILVNPDPVSAASRKRVGPIGAVKDSYMRNPWMISLVARQLARLLTPQRAKDLLMKTVGSSAPDRAAIEDPVVVHDFYRGIRMFGTGRIEGYVNEQSAFATMPIDRPIADRGEWRILIADEDAMHDREDVRSYWQTVLPDTPQTTIGGQGRLMILADPTPILVSLDRARMAAA